MAIIDDSKRMSSEDIKKIFTNVISKNAEKAVNQAKYDRTILATIQYKNQTWDCGSSRALTSRSLAVS